MRLDWVGETQQQQTFFKTKYKNRNMKANYNEQPKALELMPDGYHKFRYAITETTNGETTSYDCQEVIIHGAVTTDKVIAAVISDRWATGVEQKLINDYNEYKLGVGNATAETDYLNFLTERKALKEYVREMLNSQK